MAKKDKAKLPKKVAGVKVPKALRKSGALDKLLHTDLGREILADALIAAAGAAAAALVKNRAGTQAVQAVAHGTADAASATQRLVQTAAGAVADVVTDAARQFLSPAKSDDEAGGKGDALAEAAYADESKKKRRRDKDQPSQH